MADLMLVRRGHGLVPANPSDAEALQKLPIGKELRASITQMRNGKFHRKAFSLLSLGFEYWEPETVVTKIERDTVLKMCRFMVANGLPAETAKAIGTAFMEEANRQRQGVEADKSFDAFRDWVTVEAGYCRAVKTPAGVRKEPVSISFASMDETAFQGYYRAVFSVLWRLVLSKNFKTEAEAENAVAELLSFD
jgi:hypothetical protein